MVCIFQFDFFKFITKILLPYQMDYIHIALSHNEFHRCFSNSKWDLPIYTLNFVLKRNNHYFNSDRSANFYAKRSSKSNEEKCQRSINNYTDNRLFLFLQVFIFQFKIQRKGLKAKHHYKKKMFLVLELLIASTQCTIVRFRYKKTVISIFDI